MKKNRINMAMRSLVALLFVVLSINIFGSEYDEWYDSRGWWNISWKDTKTGITYQAKATYSFGNYTYSEDCYASISSDGINKEIVDFEPLSEVSFPAIKDGEGNITKYTKVPVNRIMGTISGDNIKSISFPESIVYFGNFNGVELRIECDNLQTIKFGDNNKIKDADNFSVSITSKYLESLIIPDGVTGLGNYTGCLDLHCPALKTVTIPKSVKWAGGEETPNGPTYSGALGSNFPNLETICFNDDVTTIPSLFGCCFNLKNIEWPSKVEKIEDYAFLGCTGLQSVKFPKTLNAIGRGAFLGCSGLKDIYVCWETPIEDEHYDTYLKSVNGEWVMSTITTFSGAHDTEKIRVNGIDLPTDEMINPGTYENAILHLVQDSPNEPGPSTYKYKRTSPWKYFRHIKHPGGLIHNFVITVTANGNGKVEYDHWTTIDDGQTTTVETCEVRNETKDFKVSTPTLPTEDEFKIVLDEGASLKSVTVDGKDMTNNVEIEQNTNTGILLLSNITGATTIDVKFSGAEDPKDNQTFTSKSAEGVEMTFTILDEQKKICMVGVDNTDKTWLNAVTAIDNNTTGKLTIPEKANGYVVEKVGDYAFYSCKISEIVLPEGLASIGTFAFANCPITSVTLPSTLTFIGSNAFTKLETVYSYVVDPFELSEKAFNYTNYQVAGGDGTTYYYYTANLYVPKGTKEKYASTPSWNHFMDNGDRIIEMGQAEDNIQFADSNVKAICVQNWDKDYDGELSKEEAATVKNIGTVFKETQIHMFNELQYFTGLTAIGNNAFRKCQMLTSIILPESIQKIGENAFTDCRELSALEIPATVTEIGQSVFAGCNHLIVTVAQGNKTFVAEDMMLYQKDKYGEQIETLLWCSPMKSGNVTINSAASTLADNCFYECGEIIGVEIPDNVKTLGDGVFVKCSKLENVFIGKGVESIGEGCFNATPKLRQITVYASNPYYAFDGGVLIKRQGNVLVAYPNAKGVQYKVREGIETIGKWAFYYTDIAGITLPKTLTSIEDYAFYDCKNLTEIIVNAEAVPTVAAKSFGDVTFQQATLTVPAGMKSKYQAAEGWKNFQNIVEEGKQESIDPIETETVVNVNDLSGEDLTDNVIDDVYYNTGDGSYDATDGSIVISETTNMGLITNAEPGSDDVKNNFTGIILKVAAGKGTIKVNVKTSGNAQLVVQIGNGTPMIASKTEQGDVVVSYDVAEDTYVYIYAIIGSSASPSMRASSTDEVRIYGFTVSPGASGVKAVWASEDCNAQIFSLDGKPLNEPQKGVNIVRMNNGQVRKVVVK